MLQAARLVRVGGLRACGSGSASLLSQHGFASEAEDARQQSGDPQHQAAQRQEGRGGGGGGGGGGPRGSRAETPRKQRPQRGEFPMEEGAQINKKMYPAYLCNVNWASAVLCSGTDCRPFFRLAEPRAPVGGALKLSCTCSCFVYAQRCMAHIPAAPPDPLLLHAVPPSCPSFAACRACCGRTLLPFLMATTCRSKKSGENPPLAVLAGYVTSSPELNAPLNVHSCKLAAASARWALRTAGPTVCCHEATCQQR